jgi:hypothetical protein
MTTIGKTRASVGAVVIAALLVSALTWTASASASPPKARCNPNKTVCTSSASSSTSTVPSSTTTTAAPSTTTSSVAPTTTTTAPTTTTTTAPPATYPYTIAPNTQGSWVSPEGLKINVATAGPWTIRAIYKMVLESSAAPGDFATIAPNVSVEVQDAKPSQTTTGASTTGGVYASFHATVLLQGINSTFASKPDYITAHEFGHAWTMYYRFMAQNGSWSPYLGYRWSNSDGSLKLATDSRLDTTYGWSRNEIAAEDYRLLFGSPAAISQAPTHLNTSIPEPVDVPNLRHFFLSTWR